MEPNDTVAKAQPISVLPATVSGSIASTGDLDHYRFSLPAGKKLTATLTPALASSGFGLAVLNSAGQTLVALPAGAGQTSQVVISNSGGTAITLLFKVARSTGAAGAYKLQMLY